MNVSLHSTTLSPSNWKGLVLYKKSLHQILQVDGNYILPLSIPRIHIGRLTSTYYRERETKSYLFLFSFFHIFPFTPSSGFPHHSTSLFRNRQVDHIGMAVLWLSFVVVCHTPSLVLSPYPLVIFFQIPRIFIHTFSFAQLIITMTFI